MSKVVARFPRRIDLPALQIEQQHALLQRVATVHVLPEVDVVEALLGRVRRVGLVLRPTRLAARRVRRHRRHHLAVLRRLVAAAPDGETLYVLLVVRGYGKAARVVLGAALRFRPLPALRVDAVEGEMGCYEAHGWCDGGHGRGGEAVEDRQGSLPEDEVEATEGRRQERSGPGEKPAEYRKDAKGSV